MTVQELHLKIDKYLQEINTNIYGNVLPEEKDLFLNDEVLEFVRNQTSINSNRLQQGFEETKQRYDNIKELIKSVNLTLYKKSSNKVYCIQPPDYFRGINYICNGVTYCNTFTIIENPDNKHIVRLKLKQANTDTQAYKDLKLTVSGTDIFKLNDFYNDGLIARELDYEVKWLIFEELNKLDNYKCYWENYNNNFYTGELIIEKSSSFTLVLSNYTGGTGSSINSVEVILTKYTYDENLTEVEIPTRQINHEDIINNEYNIFSKSNKNSITFSLLKDTSVFILPKKTMLFSTQLIYIKKPSRISLYLNRNSELNSNILDIIARKTAAKISIIKGNNNAKNLIESNILIE